MNIRQAKSDDILTLSKWMSSLKDHVLQSTDDIYISSISDASRDSLCSYFEKVLNSEEYIVLLAEDEGNPVAFIEGKLSVPIFQPSTIGLIGIIEMCWVEPEYRAKGIAGQLVENIEQLFKMSGAEFVDMYYIVGNKDAEQCWTKLGYLPYRIASRKKL